MSQPLPITLRLACLEDKPALYELIDQSVRQLQKNDYNSQQLEALLAHVFGVDTQLIEDGTYYIAESGDTLVGSGGWSKRKTLFGGDQASNREDNLLDPAVDPAKIRAFFVHPDWARQGIGRKLMEQCEQAAYAAGFRRLELMATLTGVALYTATGFEPIEQAEIPLPDGMSAGGVRMGKNL